MNSIRKKVLYLTTVTAGLTLTGHAQPTPSVRMQPDAIVTLPAGAGLVAIAEGDFNHDTRRDLAVCERNLGQVVLYMRSAAGTYPTAKYTYAVGQAPSGLVSFNREAGRYHADLMAVSGPSSQWTMLRDDVDTTGNLVRRVLTPGFGTGEPSPRPQLVQTDIEQDGTPDFIYTYPSSYNSFVRSSRFFNDTYSPTTPSNQRRIDTPYLNTGYNTSSSLTLADFDQNGFLDQVLTDSAANMVHVVSQFLSQVAFLQNSGRGPVHTAAQDIDGDQLPDLAIAYGASKEVIVLRTTTTFEFNRSYSYALPAAPRRVLLADLNRDFYPELLVVTADNQLRIYQHNGTNSALCYTTIAPQVIATGVAPELLQIAYLDGDNYPDVIVGCPGDNTVRTYLNRSSVVTATRSNQLLTGISVFPTLATNEITVRQTGNVPLTITLLDEVGRPVRQQTLAQPTSTIATGDLQRGFYVLRLVGEKGTHTTRIVLQ